MIVIIFTVAILGTFAVAALVCEAMDAHDQAERFRRLLEAERRCACRAGEEQS